MPRGATAQSADEESCEVAAELGLETLAGGRPRLAETIEGGAVLSDPEGSSLLALGEYGTDSFHRVPE